MPTLKNDKAGAPRTMGKTNQRTTVTHHGAGATGGHVAPGTNMADEAQSLTDIERILGPDWRTQAANAEQLNLPGFGQATGGRHEFGGNPAISAAMNQAGWTPQQQALWLAQGYLADNPTQNPNYTGPSDAGAANGQWVAGPNGGMVWNPTGHTGVVSPFTLQDLANNPWMRAHGVNIPGATELSPPDPAAATGPLPAAGNPAPSPTDPFAVPQPGTPSPVTPAPTSSRPTPIPDPAGPAAKSAAAPAPAPAPSPFSVTPKPPQASDALGAPAKTLAPSPFAGSAAGVGATTQGADVDKTDNTPSPQPPQPRPVTGPKPPQPADSGTPGDALAAGAQKQTPPSPFDPNAQRPKFATGPSVTAATAAQTPSSSLQGY